MQDADAGCTMDNRRWMMEAEAEVEAAVETMEIEMDVGTKRPRWIDTTYLVMENAKCKMQS
jgi:hypothetical protein